ISIKQEIGPEVAYPWLQKLFSGFKVNDLKSLVEKSNDRNLGDRLTNISIDSSHQLLWESGIVETNFVSGLRVVPEIATIMHAFRKNGIEVYVVSASMEEVVEVFATNPKYGYHLPI